MSYILNERKNNNKESEMKVKRKAQIFNLPEPMLARLKTFANKKGLGLTELLKRIIERYFESECDEIKNKP